MLNKKFKNLLVLFIAVFGLAQAAQAGLNLSQGTKTAGGSANFTFQKAAGASFDTMDYGFDAGVTIGYFVLDNWEVSTLFELSFSFNKLNTVTNTREFTFDGLCFGLGTNYYFDFGSVIYPYLGLGLVVTADNEFKPTVWGLKLQPRLGMLLALNCEVALDFGLQTGLEWQLTDKHTQLPTPSVVLASGDPAINAIAGYFGVRGFF